MRSRSNEEAGRDEVGADRMATVFGGCVPGQEKDSPRAAPEVMDVIKVGWRRAIAPQRGGGGFWTMFLLMLERKRRGE